MTLPLVVQMTVDSGTTYELSADTNLQEIDLDNELQINVVGYDVPEYQGSYTVDAGLSPVVLNTQDKRLTQDITVNALTENQVTGNSLTINQDTGRVSSLVSISAGYSPVTFGVNKTLQLSTQARATITPTTSEQTAVAKGKYTTGIVKVGAMPTGSRGTPTATKGSVSNHSVSVTPSVTNTTGYIEGGTVTGTPVSVSASELVSGNKAISANGNNIDVANYSTVSVNVPNPSTGTLNITANDTYDVTDYASAVVNVPTGTTGYTVTNNLTNVTTNNTTTEVLANQPYYATLSTNYAFDSCTVTMGNVDITSTAFDSTDLSITIPSVTGNIVITANAEAFTVVYTQGSKGGNNTNANRVTGVIMSPIHLDNEYLTVSAPSNYLLYPFMVTANNNARVAGTRSGENRLYIYAEADNGYIATQNTDISGLKANNTTLTGIVKNWEGSTMTYTFTKPNQYGYTFTGIRFVVKKSDESNITPSQIESIISVTYHNETSASQALNVILGGETV